MIFDWIEKPSQNEFAWCIIEVCLSEVCWTEGCPSRCDTYGCPSKCGMIFSSGIACL